MDRWDQGFVEVQHSDIEAGTLLVSPAEPRVVLFDVQSTDPPEYLLMGQLIEGGISWKVLLVLGSEHIDRMW